MRIEDPNTHSDYEDWPQPAKRGFNLKPEKNVQEYFTRIYNTPGDFREGHETRDFNIENVFKPGDVGMPSSEAYNYYLEQSKNRPPYIQQMVVDLSEPDNGEIQSSDVDSDQPDEKDRLYNFMNNVGWIDSNLEKPENILRDPYYVSTSEFLTQNRLKSDLFNQHYNTPEKFRQGYESRDGDVESKVGNYENDEIQEPRIYIDEDEMEHHKDETGSGEFDQRINEMRRLKYLEKLQEQSTNILIRDLI